jgi:hypothetical protein
MTVEENEFNNKSDCSCVIICLGTAILRPCHIKGILRFNLKECLWRPECRWKNIKIDTSLPVIVAVHDKWVPVTMAWLVLRLQMEERTPIWRVAVKTLNKQSLTTDKVWSSSLEVG